MGLSFSNARWIGTKKREVVLARVEGVDKLMCGHSYKGRFDATLDVPSGELSS